eukprot:EG_transcript_379
MASSVEALVVRRLQAKLTNGPRLVFSLRGFLGNPEDGGSPADMAAVPDWEAFAQRHNSIFRYAGSGSKATLSLVAPSPTTTAVHPTTEAAVVRRLQAKLAAGPVSVATLAAFLGNPAEGGCPTDLKVVQNWQAFAHRHHDLFQYVTVGTQSKLQLVSAPPVGVSKSTVAAKLRPGLSAVETRVLRRLEAKLAGGPVLLSTLRSFLGDPGQGGCREDLEAVPEWEAFAQRHCGVFLMSGSGSKGKLGLAGSAAATAQAAPGATPEDEHSPALFRAQMVLQQAIVKCASFPVPLATLEDAMTQVDKAVPHILKKLGYGAKGPHSFRDFVQLTLQAFPKLSKDHSVVENKGAVVLAKETNKNLSSGSTPKAAAISPSAVERRVVERLLAKLALGPRPMNDLRSFLANPVEGGCQEDLEAFADGLQFVQRHAENFKCDTSGPVPVICLRSSLPSTLGDKKELHELCRLLCEVLVTQPTFPVVQGALKTQLRASQPEMSRILQEHGFAANGQNFCKFVQLTLERFPKQLRDFELEMGAGHGIVNRCSASSPPPIPKDPPVPSPRPSVVSAASGDAAELQAMCGLLCDTILALPKFPASLLGLKQELMAVQPSINEILRKHGYGANNRPFCNFIELTLRSFPTELADFALSIKGKGGAVVRRSAPSSPVTGGLSESGTLDASGCDGSNDDTATGSWLVEAASEVDVLDSNGSQAASFRPADTDEVNIRNHKLHQMQRLLVGVLRGTELSTVDLAALGCALKQRDPQAQDVLMELGYKRGGSHRFVDFVRETLHSCSQELQGYELVEGPSSFQVQRSCIDNASLQSNGCIGGQTHTPVPAPQENERSTTSSVAICEVSPWDMHCALRDIILTHPSLPVKLVKLAERLRKRWPGVYLPLVENGYAMSGQGFSNFLQLTLDTYPDELAAFQVVVDGDERTLQRRSTGEPLPVPPLAVPPATLSAGPRQDTSPIQNVAGWQRLEETLLDAVVLLDYVADPDHLVGVVADLHAAYAESLDGDLEPRLKHMAVASKGSPRDLLLLQVATPWQMYLFDIVVLGASAVCEALRPFLECRTLQKTMHCLQNDAAAFSRLGIRLAGVLDTQLAYEHVTGDPHNTVADVLARWGPPVDEARGPVVRWTRPPGAVTQPRLQRSLEADLLSVARLAACRPAVVAELGPDLDAIVDASGFRAELFADRSVAGPLFGFHRGQGFRLASYELLRVVCPADLLDPGSGGVDPTVAQSALAWLPAPFRSAVAGQSADVTHVVLDVGRRPQAFCGARRAFLAEDASVLVTPEHISEVVGTLGPDSLSNSNWARLPGTLHQVSALRNRQGGIMGVTVLLDRPVPGLAFILSDVLLGMQDRSVLFLGDRGAGKTTALREVARLLSEEQLVLAVDTTNALGGDADVPAPGLGLARRAMVPAPGRQAAVVEECLWYHRPRVLVVDEISDGSDVEAARTVKGHGVRVVAGARGGLRCLLKNPELRGLLGDFQDTILPSGECCVKRIGEPIFDCVVELCRGSFGEWLVVKNVAEAVDQALLDESYPCHRRSRDP